MTLQWITPECIKECSRWLFPLAYFQPPINFLPACFKSYSILIDIPYFFQSDFMKTKLITPFYKACQFPAHSWQTPSLALAEHCFSFISYHLDPSPLCHLYLTEFKFLKWVLIFFASIITEYDVSLLKQLYFLENPYRN